MKLWEGRMSGEVDARLNQLNASIGFDQRMYRQDIRGSMAHARMLGKTGILSPEDTQAILSGLAAILADIDAGRLTIDPEAEDIHTFVEGELTARIGDAGKRLHTGRSRNDQVALDDRLYLADETLELIAGVKCLAETLCTVAEGHLTDVMPGYTHLQRAQPVTLAHALMAYAQMLLRDMSRLRDCRGRTMVSPLGSGALAGTTYPLDRRMVAQELGFHGISMNSIDWRFRPGFRPGIDERTVHPHDAPVPAQRGDLPVVQLGIPVYDVGRSLLHRLVHYAPEKESGHCRTGAG